MGRGGDDRNGGGHGGKEVWGKAEEEDDGDKEGPPAEKANFDLSGALVADEVGLCRLL